MKDLIKKVLRESTKKINEAPGVKYSPCETEFGEKSIQREFCRSVASKLPKNYRGKFKQAFFEYIEQNKENLIFQVEELTQESENFKERYNEVIDVTRKLNGNCDGEIIKSAIDQIFDKSIKKGILFYIQNDGKYSLFNKFDTSYAPQAVLITRWINNQTSPSIFTNEQNKLNATQRKEIGENLATEVLNNESFWKNQLFGIFDVLFNKKHLINNTSTELLKLVDGVLTQNQAYGAELEEEFIKQMTEYGYKIQKTSEQYGFVDMFLGIDFIFWSEKLKSWIPAQIKHNISGTSQLDKLGCRYYLKGTKFLNQTQYISNAPF